MGVLKIIVKVLSWICYVVIGIYAFVCLPMITGAKPVVVLSGSMRPTYEVGTIIYYKAVPQEEITPETVITFKMENELVTHRVKRIQDGEYVTKGDANNTEDGKTVPYSAVQGKVDGLALPILGFGVQFINSNFWVFIIIIAILLAEFLISNIKCDKISVSEKGRSEKDD